MTKVVGSFASVTRGVSEQVPQDRRPGQMWEQVNMISDPVVGLARRPGSTWLDSIDASATSWLDANIVADAHLYRNYTFFLRGKEYLVIYRSGTPVVGLTTPPIVCFCKTTGKFLNTIYADGGTAQTAVAAAGFAPWRDTGVSALTSVGDYLLLAANNLGPTYSVNDRYAATSTAFVAWVRNGAFSRTYTLKVTRKSDNAQFTAQYTTMASSYPNLLSTSDIPAGGSDYQKLVNDRVNAYNSAVNKWIGDAMASIQPQNIAQQLSNTLAAQGFVNQYVIGSTIVGDNCASVSCEDGGDGTTFRAVFNTLDAVEKLSSIHSDGKVVQIKANNQVDPYYMVFKGNKVGDWGTGTWLEGPAQIVTPNSGFGVAGVSTDGTDFVVASTPAVLNACMDRNTYPAGNVSYGFSCPSFATSVCGDLTQSGAIPYFFQKRVSLMTVFQDRLVIVADGTVFMSRTGDYFNFFRRTMLSVQDDDPIEVYALGASDDVISRAVTYNKNLFMFGQRNQYVIPGSQIASPKTISVSTVASERDAMLSQPVTSGNLIFYGTQRQASDTTGPYSGIINQFQLGLFQDTPETYQISKQLSKYLSGRPLEMAAISSPPTLFVRTDGLDNGFYVYSYLDAPGSQERQFDSWGRWELYKDFGTLLSITSYQQKVIAFFLAPDAMAGAATKLRISALEFTMDTTDRSRPFLDCMHRLDQSGPIYTQWNNWQTSKMWPGARTAISAAYPEFLTSSPMSQWGGFAAQYYGPIPASGFVVGFDYDSYATITSPYVRDSNDKAVVNGRLVINKYAVSLTETAGCRVTLTDVTGADKQIGDFNGRLVSRSNNLVGRVPVSTTVYSVPVGRANTEHRITFHSKPVLPMTISAIEWIGQLFTSGRRV